MIFASSLSSKEIWRLSVLLLLRLSFCLKCSPRTTALLFVANVTVSCFLTCTNHSCTQKARYTISCQGNGKHSVLTNLFLCSLQKHNSSPWWTAEKRKEDANNYACLPLVMCHVFVNKISSLSKRKTNLSISFLCVFNNNKPSYPSTSTF